MPPVPKVPLLEKLLPRREPAGMSEVTALCPRRWRAVFLSAAVNAQRASGGLEVG